jgi:ferredoxin
MPTIILDNGTLIQTPTGKRLVLALEDGGVDMLHRCGGYAKCTTCRVSFVEGEPAPMTAAERDRLADGGLFGQVRLSCQIICDHDMQLATINHLIGSPYDSAGNRPHDEITPDPLWIHRPH